MEHLLLRIQYGALATLGLQFCPAVFDVRTCAAQVGLSACQLRAGRVNVGLPAGALRLKPFFVRDRLFEPLPCC